MAAPGMIKFPLDVVAAGGLGKAQSGSRGLHAPMPGHASQIDDVSCQRRTNARLAPHANRFAKQPLAPVVCAPFPRQRPVLPKPPSERSLAAKSATTSNSACTTGTMTSCASRSSGWSE